MVPKSFQIGTKVEQWSNGTMEKWHNGTIQKLHNGTMHKLHNGNISAATARRLCPPSRTLASTRQCAKSVGSQRGCRARHEGFDLMSPKQFSKRFIFLGFSVILLPGLGHGGGTAQIHQNAFKWMVLVWFWDIFVFWPSGVAWLA